MVQTRLADFIRLLGPNSAENVAAIRGLFEHKRLTKGEVVLKAGQHCPSFYFVESGFLRTFYTKEDVDITINFHLEGSITSDYKNAEAGIPSEFTIAAGQPSEIWSLDRKRLEDLCHRNPEIRVFGLRLVTRLLLDDSLPSALFKMYTPQERYQYVEKNQACLLQRVSLSHLASFLGITRRTLTRIRAQK